MARRRLRPDEARLWGLVSSTVRPGRKAERLPKPEIEPEAVIPPPPAPVRAPRPRPSPEALATLAAGGGFQPTRTGRPDSPTAPLADPPPIEPNRRRRLARARDPIGARLDLHGMDQDRARASLHAFLLRAHADGLRAVLVITGKGRISDGVLRQRVPEWLAEAPARAVIAGVSSAERRHGGEGALYVALRGPP